MNSSQWSLTGKIPTDFTRLSVKKSVRKLSMLCLPQKNDKYICGKLSIEIFLQKKSKLQKKDESILHKNFISKRIN